MTNNVAAIDLGSNSCRLIIADSKGKYIYKDAISTKLSQGMQANKKLTEEAQQRTINALKEYAQIINEHNVKKYRAITTAATRQATNGKEFIEKVFNETGIKLETISEEQEALLNLQGAIVHSLGKSEYVCVFDIGGASTEVTIATNNAKPKIIQSTSIPLGCRNASEKYNLYEYNKEGAQSLANEVNKYIKDFKMPKDCKTIGISSIPLRLSAMINNKKSYDREEADGQIITTQQINKKSDDLYKKTREELANNPLIGEKRSYIILAGIIILQTIIQKLEIEDLTASLQSAKNAIIKDLTSQQSLPAINIKDIER